MRVRRPVGVGLDATNSLIGPGPRDKALTVGGECRHACSLTDGGGCCTPSRMVDVSCVDLSLDRYSVAGSPLGTAMHAIASPAPIAIRMPE
jgi:hypothetical protein